MPAGAFGGELARRLLRVLATRRGQLVPRDVLVEALWPDGTPADPQANLNALVGRVRRALTGGAFIQTRPGGYVLDGGDDCTVDAETVLAAVERGRAHAADGHHAAARRWYEEALARWAGEPLPQDRYADWARDHRRRLERAWVEALEGASRAALALGDTAAARERAEQVVAAEPLREAAHGLLIQVLAAAGDRAGALAAYARLRTTLADELGIEPTPQMAALQAALLRGDDVPGAHHDAGDAVSPRMPELAFVGRDAELAATLGHLRGQRAGVVLVAGPAGSGKSRLVAEAVAAHGAPAVVVRAYLGERDEPWSLARSLVREAVSLRPDAVDAVPTAALPLMADLLPDLGPAPQAAVDEESRRALRLEGCLRLVRMAVEDRLLVLDDVQWADATSVRLVRRLPDRVAFGGMLVAYRPEEAREHETAGRLLADLERSGHVLRVPLAPLDAAAIARLVPDQALAAVIERDTDRTPFAVAELLRTLASQGLVRDDGTGRWTLRDPQAEPSAAAAARDGQTRAVVSRVQRLPERHRRALHLLALFARETPAALLADAADEPTAAALDVLAALDAAGLARPGDVGWHVGHDLIGEILGRRLDKADRMRLHAAIAAALVRAGADVAEIARHRDRAGDPAAAATYLAAARAGLERHTVAEAQQLVEAGLRLAPPPAMTAALLEVRAEARARTGDLRGARTDLRAALRHQGSSADRARVLARMAMAALGADDLLHAGELAELALVEAGAVPSSRARALAVAAVVDMNTGAPERAEQRSAEALELFQQGGDARGVADILDGRAMATFLDGRIVAALDAFDRVARLFTDAGDLLRVVTPRSTRGHALVFAARPDDGLTDIDAALRLADDLGHPEGQTYALWHRAEALAALGRVGDAVADAERALGLARRLGHRGWTATALRAVGVTQTAAGDLDAAERAFRASLGAAVNLPLFASWAAARLALTRLARGDTDEAGHLVDLALAQGPPLAGFEARLVQVEVAVAVGDPSAPRLARTALDLAERAGHAASAVRLRALAGDSAHTPGGAG